MAVDTRDKRSSAIHVGLPWRGMFPVADGTIGAADRQHAATLYAGILAGEVIAAPAVASRIVRLISGGRVLRQLIAGGSADVRLRSGGDVPPRLTIGTSEL